MDYRTKPLERACIGCQRRNNAAEVICISQHLKGPLIQVRSTVEDNVATLNLRRILVAPVPSVTASVPTYVNHDIPVIVTTIVATTGFWPRIALRRSNARQ